MVSLLPERPLIPLGFLVFSMAFLVSDVGDFEASLGSLLVERGKLERSGLERALRVASSREERLGTLLPKLGLVSERDLAEALSELLELPLVGAADFPEEPLLSDKLSSRFLRESHVLPLEDREEGLVLALSDPLDDYVLDALRLTSGRDLLICVAEPSELEAAIERLYGAGRDARGRDVEEIDGTLSVGEAGLDLDVERLKDLASEAPVIRLVNQLIHRAVEARASDIHIEPLRKIGQQDHAPNVGDL